MPIGNRIIRYPKDHILATPMRYLTIVHRPSGLLTDEAHKSRIIPVKKLGVSMRRRRPPRARQDALTELRLSRFLFAN